MARFIPRSSERRTSGPLVRRVTCVAEYPTALRLAHENRLAVARDISATHLYRTVWEMQSKKRTSSLEEDVSPNRQ